ncbi:MAG: AraC family transcriptional regulator [Pseudomonadales bacterium]
MLRASKILQYLSFMENQGFDADQVLARSGLSPNKLRQTKMDLSYAQLQTIIQNMISLTGNTALGFEIGSRLSPSDMGAVGHGMLVAPTFRQTIQIWRAYAPTLFGSVIQLSLAEEEQLWRMYVTATLPAGVCYQFCLEEYLALVASMGERILGDSVSYGELQIQYAAPPHRADYQKLFRCPVRFDCARTCISVRHPKLDDTIQTRDEYLFPIYQHYCARQSNTVIDESSQAFGVHSYLLKSLGNPPDLVHMAEGEECSPSTLRRRLKAEGVNFRKLRNEFRQDFAKEYLKTTTLSAKEIAYLLGYRDTKPFLRAFKRWTGMSVGQYSKTFGPD